MDEHLESGPAVSEPEVSEQPGDERTSSSHTGGGEQLMELEARLEARIQDEVERRFQSAKDRRWSQLEKQYGMLSEQAAQPAARDKAAAGAETLTDAAVPAMRRAQRLLELAGLGNDPEALELLRGEHAQGGEEGELHLLSEVAELALRRLKRPAPRAGAVVQPSGGMPSADLRAEYEQKLKGLRPGDVAGLSDLKREFRGKGLDVY